MIATPDRHDGESFRISYCGYHVGYARSVRELERRIELADLQEVLTEQREDLVVILAGQADQLRNLLQATPTLASRFPAAVDFPGYTVAELAEIFATLAGEAGFTLTPAAARAASAVLGRARGDRADGSARLAVWLLDQATASQAHRITTARQPPSPAALCTISAADIPDQMQLHGSPEPAHTDEERPGPYL